MIKRMIGVIAALAVAAVIVWTVMHRDAYRSMCFDGPEPAVVSGTAGAGAASASAGSADSDAAAGEDDLRQEADSPAGN